MAAPAKTLEKQSTKIADSAQTLEARSLELVWFGSTGGPEA